MGDHLAVGAAAEVMAARSQLLPQPAEVVDLAVAGDLDGGVLAGDRLLSRLQVDDRQALEPQRHLAGEEELTGVVGPAVGDRGAHPAQGLAVAADLSRPARDPAHRYPTTRRSR